MKQTELRPMRTIREIAREIREDWKKVSPYAEPYLQAMAKLESLNDTYGYEYGDEIVLRFLSNAQSWRGEKAREIKKELKKMVLCLY
jgi:hypothetical protein